MTTPVAGWLHLNSAEYDQVWDVFYKRFRFRPGMDPSQWPAIIEPVPSLTWDLAISRHDFNERWQSGLWRFAVDEDELNSTAATERLPTTSNSYHPSRTPAEAL